MLISRSSARPRITRLRRSVVQSIAEFARLEVAGSAILLAATILALLLANSPLAADYAAILKIDVGAAIGDLTLTQTVGHWVNDGLMAVFFLVVGLEIKREFLAGELAEPRKALLPLLAALGGMLVPAGLYALLNIGGSGLRGWGIPMATDIAFALGLLALLGDRVPIGLKVFLTALAIVDDLGAIVVIALFYTTDIRWAWLGFGAALLLLMYSLNRLGVRSLRLYLPLAALVWLAFLQSGVHATIAGVLIALTIPVDNQLAPIEFVALAREQIDTIERIDRPHDPAIKDDEQQRIALSLQAAAQRMQAPLQRLEFALHPLSTYAILPIFALANAGIPLGGVSALQIVSSPVSLGVFAGLVVGKQLGIALMSYLAVRTGLAALPEGVSWPQIYGAALLSGVGFTMSLFITELAFGGDPILATEARVAILLASLLAGALGLFVLNGACPRQPQEAV